jgi:hypothetical protein
VTIIDIVRRFVFLLNIETLSAITMSVSTPLNGVGSMAVQLCSASPQSASSTQSALVVTGSELVMDGAGDSSLALSTDGGCGGDDSNSAFSDDEVK